MDAAVIAGLVGATPPTLVSLIANYILYKQLHIYKDQLAVMSVSLENVRSAERGQIYMMKSQISLIQDELQDFIPEDALDSARLLHFDLAIFHDFRSLAHLVSSPTIESIPALKGELEEFSDMVRDVTRDIKVARRKREISPHDLKEIKNSLQAIYLKCDDCLTKFPR